MKMVRRLSLLIILALLGLSSLVAASNPSGAGNGAAFSLPQDEELVYQAELSRSLIRGLDVAEFRLSAKRASEAGAAGRSDNVSHIHFEAVSKGLLKSLFGLRFHQRIESTVQTDSLIVLKTRRSDEQGDRRRESETVYDRNARKIVWTERDPNDPSRPARVVTNDLEAESQDLASLIYYLRAQPLAVGQNFEVLVNDSGRVYRVPVHVVERKRLKSVVGETEALRVEPEMFGEGRPLRGNGQMSIWITDDARRIPVRAEIKSGMGTLNIKLKSLSSAPQTAAR